MAESEKFNCGIVVVDDYDPGLSLNQRKNLGVVFVDNDQVNLTQLRSIIDTDLNEQLNTCGISGSNYGFVVQKGTSTFPVNPNQEKKFCVADVINDEIIAINRKTDVPRIWILTENGCKIGFVETKLTTCLKKLRKEVKLLLKQFTELKKCRKLSNFWSRSQFQFFDRNGETVLLINEEKLQILNIIDNTNNSIRINLKSKDTTDDSNGLKHLSAASIGSGIPSSLSDDIDDVMISYSREQASLHAELLYSKLRDLRVKVFLDKHGIDGGSDWQDKLNRKIRECKIFIAFVTSKYGKTRWTDVEFKAAVVVEKCIVPVKFLDNYPPENYIMQLASIQYIEGIAEKPPQYITKSWKEEEAERVAKEVYEIMKKHKPKRIDFDSSHKIQSDSKEIINVVFLAHPSQREMFEQLSQLLVSRIEKMNIKCLVNYGDGVHQSNTKTSNVTAKPDSESPNFQRQFSVIEKEKQIREFKAMIKSAKVVIALFSDNFSKSKSLLDYFKFARLYRSVNLVLCDDTQLTGWLSQHVSHNDYINPLEESFEDKLVMRVKNQIQSNRIEPEIGTMSTLAEQIISLPLEYNTVFICVESMSVLENEAQVWTAFGKQLATLKNFTVVTYGVNALAECVAKEIHHLNSESETESLKVLNIRTSSVQSEEEQSLSSVYTVFVNKTERETINEISMVCDLCVLITDNEQNSNALYSFVWNAKQVIPVLVNEAVEVNELSDTFYTFHALYDVNRSRLTLNGNNAVDVAETVTTLIEKLELD